METSALNAPKDAPPANPPTSTIANHAKTISYFTTINAIHHVQKGQSSQMMNKNVWNAKETVLAAILLTGHIAIHAKESLYCTRLNAFQNVAEERSFRTQRGNASIAIINAFHATLGIQTYASNATAAT